MSRRGRSEKDVEEEVDGGDAHRRVEQRGRRVHEHPAHVLRLLLADAELVLVHLERGLELLHPREALHAHRAPRELERQLLRRDSGVVYREPVLPHHRQLVRVEQRLVRAISVHQPALQQVVLVVRRHPAKQLVLIKVDDQRQVQRRLPVRNPPVRRLAGDGSGLRAATQLLLPRRGFTGGELAQPERLGPSAVHDERLRQRRRRPRVVGAGRGWVG
mmetsp:Transcript_47313/g.147914  ORF Transcript_47313/g.147914 Transcript_47313/m.147914 type:complete len:217 (+) Transcript_47313:890-1540(+)